MDAHTLLEEWEVSPFDGGFEGLRDLESRGFSGAVEAGGRVLFMRDGEPLAVVADLAGDPRPADVDAFADAAGDLHEAQRPETATLAAMLALDGDVRGQYFTEDTSLSTVHETLSGGGFTGYVELSENVLSGDYYVVYRDGHEEYVAFVGSGDRVIADDEAQSKAAGEVGIYSVVGVSLPDVAVPRTDETEETGAGGTAAGSAAGDAPASRDATDGESTGGDPTGEESASGDGASGGGSNGGSPGGDATIDGATAGGTEPDTATAEHVPTDGAGEGVTDGDVTGGGGSNDEGATAGSEPTPQLTESGDDPAESGTGSGAGRTTGSTYESTDAGTDAINVASGPADEPGASGLTGPGPSGESTGGSGDDLPAGADAEPAPEAETGGEHGRSGAGGSVIDAVSSRTVPSLDPQNSRRDRGDDGDSSSSLTGRRPAREPASGTEPRSEAGEGSSPSTESTGDVVRAADPEPDQDVQRRVEAVHEEYEERIEELRGEIGELRTELDELRDERDELRRRLESGDAGGADETGGAAGAERSLPPSEAIAGTSLFVREGTRGEATLEDARDGATDRETLSENVRVEYHTEFDDDGVTVEGRPFEEWLHESVHYRFVRWTIVDLLFEIRSTGSASSMRQLYDALPSVDRVGLRDTITFGEGEERREITFDVVARDQMGDPLFVATIDESRDPTPGAAMEPLVTDASDVCEHHETLAGTFAVTSSYFEPAALDTVREATSGSLLGRDRYRSYVKLARKNGFHVCMVERRDDAFHLTVPEL